MKKLRQVMGGIKGRVYSVCFRLEDARLMLPIRKVIDETRSKRYNTYFMKERWLAKKASEVTLSPKAEDEQFFTNIKTVMSPVAASSYKKDLVIEQILDQGEYTFEKSLFIRNPYKFSLLSGLLIFVTQEECKVEYTVFGKDGVKDYVACDEVLTKRHRVPIMGLFPSCKNKVEIRLHTQDGTLLAKKCIYVLTPSLPRSINKSVDITKSSGELSTSFIMATGGYIGETYAFDEKGNIRFYISCLATHPYGVYRIDNGRILFPVKKHRRPNYGNAHSVIAHEMDLMGRIYKTYYHLQGYHHWGSYKKNDGNILVATSSIRDRYMENMIEEIDYATGKTVRFLNVNELFDNTYITRYDWAHINAFEYLPEEDAILICMRNIHTIAKVSMKTKEILWLLANPDFYKNTEQEDKVLVPDQGVEWFFQQHAVSVVSNDNHGKLCIMLFDNHTANRRPVDYFDKKEESNVVIYCIDEKNKKVHMEKRIPVPMSATRSNAVMDKENNRLFAMCANLKPEIDQYKAKIYEYDYETENCINEISFRNAFFVAYPLEFNIHLMSKPLKQEEPLFAGKLYGLEKIEQLPEEMEKAQLVTKNILDMVNFRLNGNILQIYCTDHDVEKVYFYNDKEVYVQDYADTEQLTEIFKVQRYYVNIPLESLGEGKYYIGIQYIGKSYRTEFWVSRYGEEGKG